jgi:hypothetical protein
MSTVTTPPPAQRVDISIANVQNNVESNENIQESSEASPETQGFNMDSYLENGIESADPPPRYHPPRSRATLLRVHGIPVDNDISYQSYVQRNDATTNVVTEEITRPIGMIASSSRAVQAMGAPMNEGQDPYGAANNGISWDDVGLAARLSRTPQLQPILFPFVNLMRKWYRPYRWGMMLIACVFCLAAFVGAILATVRVQSQDVFGLWFLAAVGVLDAGFAIPLVRVLSDFSTWHVKLKPLKRFRFHRRPIEGSASAPTNIEVVEPPEPARVDVEQPISTTGLNSTRPEHLSGNIVFQNPEAIYNPIAAAQYLRRGAGVDMTFLGLWIAAAVMCPRCGPQLEAAKLCTYTAVLSYGCWISAALHTIGLGFDSRGMKLLAEAIYSILEHVDVGAYAGVDWDDVFDDGVDNDECVAVPNQPPAYELATFEPPAYVDAVSLQPIESSQYSQPIQPIQLVQPVQPVQPAQPVQSVQPAVATEAPRQGWTNPFAHAALQQPF